MATVRSLEQQIRLLFYATLDMCTVDQGSIGHITSDVLDHSDVEADLNLADLLDQHMDSFCSRIRDDLIYLPRIFLIHND